MTGRLAALFAPIVNAAKLAAWPVGSIYMSMQDTNLYAYQTYASYNPESSLALSGYTGRTGGGMQHNNMPPYIAIYMWRRTA